jgi:ribonuclease-3
MRHCQVNGWELPEYRVVAHEDGIFFIDAIVNNEDVARGYAKSKKQAEQNAAMIYFHVLKNKNRK